jgi:spoIIIJ-associated protein
MTTEELVKRVLAHMGIDDAQIEITDGEFLAITIKVSESDSGLLIGYHGEALASLQRLLQIMLQEKGGDKRVIVNINDYKERREAQIKELTEKIAQRVLESGRSYMFSFMPANERLIIHQFLSENPDFAELESVSSGDGASRRLEIRLKGDVSADTQAA